jgi:uncharacterized protein YybS (DUF2232 family)
VRAMLISERHRKEVSVLAVKGFLQVLLVVVGVALVVVGIVYFVEPAHSLPTFFPAHSSGSKHAVRHGIVAVVVGVIALGVAIALLRTRSGAHTRSR